MLWSTTNLIALFGEHSCFVAINPEGKSFEIAFFARHFSFFVGFLVLPAAVIEFVVPADRPFHVTWVRRQRGVVQENCFSSAIEKSPPHIPDGGCRLWALLIFPNRLVPGGHVITRGSTHVACDCAHGSMCRYDVAWGGQNEEMLAGEQSLWCLVDFCIQPNPSGRRQHC
jgi:hypothetical protein